MLWQLLPIIVFATFVVFSLLQLVPGDPAVTLAGDYASKERIEEIRKIYGFDRPLVVQYGVWLWHALEGDLGVSLLSSAPVSDLILLAAAEHHPDRGLCARDRGARSACRSACWRPPGSARGSTAFVTERRVARRRTAEFLARHPAGRDAVARLCTGSRRPARGRSAADPLGRAIKHATLPAIALAVGVIAELARQVRSALIEVLNSQYVRTLRAKGLGADARCCGSTGCATSA